jgi:hypothetical protein
MRGLLMVRAKDVQPIPQRVPPHHCQFLIADKGLDLGELFKR